MKTALPAEPLNAQPGDSVRMLAAMGVLAYAASLMTHEALGHGGACLAVGGHTGMLTAWRERCDFAGVVPLGFSAVALKAAGPGVQFVAGLLAWLGLYVCGSSGRKSLTLAVTIAGARLRYFLWMYMVFSLFIASSYVALSGMTGFGDAAEIVSGLQPQIAWRVGLVVLGAVAYWLSMQAAAFELKRFAGVDGASRRLYRFVWVPYVSAGVFACITAAVNQTMGRGAVLAVAAASSFGSGAGLFGLPAMQRSMVRRQALPIAAVAWSLAWGAVTALVVVGFWVWV